MGGGGWGFCVDIPGFGRDERPRRTVRTTRTVLSPPRPTSGGHSWRWLAGAHGAPDLLRLKITDGVRFLLELSLELFRPRPLFFRPVRLTRGGGGGRNDVPQWSGERATSCRCEEGVAPGEKAQAPRHSRLVGSVSVLFAGNTEGLLPELEGKTVALNDGKFFSNSERTNRDATKSRVISVDMEREHSSVK